jgi:hypothetical protein
MRLPLERLTKELLELPSPARARLAHVLIASLGEDSAELERAGLLAEVALAEEQIERGEMMNHEAAKAELLRRTHTNSDAGSIRAGAEPTQSPTAIVDTSACRPVYSYRDS